MGSEKAIFKNRVTKSLHKSVMPKGELGQWVSDQVRVPGFWFPVEQERWQT